MVFQQKKSARIVSSQLLGRGLFGVLALAVCAATASSAFASEFGAGRHVKKGVPCSACHGTKNEIVSPSIDQCQICHQLDALSAKTKNVKPSNPHVSPHYGNSLECTLCHAQHAATENYCDQCHAFKFKVP